MKDGHGLTGVPTYLEESFLCPVGLEQNPKIPISSIFMKIACFFLGYILLKSRLAFWSTWTFWSRELMLFSLQTANTACSWDWPDVCSSGLNHHRETWVGSGSLLVCLNLAWVACSCLLDGENWPRVGKFICACNVEAISALKLKCRSCSVQPALSAARVWRMDLVF